jgi:hypothetical protein
MLFRYTLRSNGPWIGLIRVTKKQEFQLPSSP